MSSQVFNDKIAEFNAKSKLARYQMICVAEQQYDEEKKLRPVYECFNDHPKWTVLEVYNIADKYQIAKVKHKRNKGEPNEILYHVFFNFKRINECLYSLESAMLYIVAKKCNAEGATGWIENMIGMKYEIEEVE